MTMVSTLLIVAGNAGSALFAGVWRSGLPLGNLGSGLPLAGKGALILSHLLE